jgi:pyruvate,water dikinase
LARISYPVIARSSSTVEDSDLSFAGIFESHICNNCSELAIAIASIKKCVYSKQVLEYCKRFNFDAKKISMAVLIQEYVEPVASGVTFTRNPLSRDSSEIYTEYSKHSSDAVTSGNKKTISIKMSKHKGGQEDIFGIKPIALKAEAFFGSPADIEWVATHKKLFVVQVRIITA